MKQTIDYPLGWLAGKPGKTTEVIWALSLEMLGQASTLREVAARKEPGVDKMLTDLEADDLEKYSAALGLIFLQMEPGKWKPGSFSGLLELASKYKLAIPEWMTAKPKLPDPKKEMEEIRKLLELSQWAAPKDPPSPK